MKILNYIQRHQILFTILGEFLLLLNAIHLTDFSHGFIAPLSLSLSFLFIVFELASFFFNFHIILIVFISKIIIFSILDCFSKNLDSVLLFSASFLAILISNYITSKKYEFIPFSFPISNKEIFNRYLCKEFYSYSFLQIPIVIFFLYFKFSILNLIVVLLFVIYSTTNDKEIRKNYAENFFSYYKNNILEIVLIFFIIFIIKNHKNIECLDKSSILSIIVPIFIFNLTSLFLIIQFNYNKYGSTYLLKNIINLPIIFLSTIIPALLIVLNSFFEKYIYRNFHYFKLLSILIVIFSTVFYLIIFISNLESWKLVNSILISITESDFENNKNNVISLDETKFEALSRIIKNDISKRDLISLRICINGLATWTEKNINKIKNRTEIYWEKKNNSFFSFYENLSFDIAKTNDGNIVEIFLNSIRKVVYEKVDSTNFIDYEIFFESLVVFTKEVITIDEEKAYDAFFILKEYITFSIQNCTNKKMTVFEKEFVEVIENIIDLALKENKIIFLNKVKILTIFISFGQSKKIIKWTSIYKDIFIRFRMIVKKISRTATVDNRILNSLLDNVNDFCSELKKQTLDTLELKSIWDYYFDLLMYIMNVAINKKIILSDFDFESFYKIFWNSISDETILKNALICFTSSLDNYFSFILKSNENQKEWIINNIWSRFIQLKKKLHNKQELYSEWEDFKVFFEKKYPQLNYNKYCQGINDSFVPIENFNYSKIDIRISKVVLNKKVKNKRNTKNRLRRKI